MQVSRNRVELLIAHTYVIIRNGHQLTHLPRCGWALLPGLTRPTAWELPLGPLCRTHWAAVLVEPTPKVSLQHLGLPSTKEGDGLAANS